MPWQVESNMASACMSGDFEIDGTSYGGGPTLIIQGRASMSDIKIEYVLKIRPGNLPALFSCGC